MDINKPGLLVHGTNTQRLDSIMKYGIVSSAHFRKGPLSYEYDSGKWGCPCGQDIPQQLKEEVGGLSCYSIIGARFRNYGTITSFKNGDGFDLPWGFPSYEFGILIDMNQILKKIPNDMSHQLRAASGIRKDVKIEKIRRYYNGLRGRIAGYIKGSDEYSFEIKLLSCIGWNDFEALVVPEKQTFYRGWTISYEEDPSMTKEKVLKELVDSMEKSKKRSQRKPIYDTKGNMLFSP